MENRIGIIDLGSNSCRLVIFALDEQLSFRLVDQVSEKVRIGEGGFAGGELLDEPMDRAVALMRLFRELCDANGIRRVLATATSAVRDAANRDEFLRRARAEAGLSLRVLSGEEEGYYAYLGVVNSLPFDDGIIGDLGGGSLELVRVRNRLPAAMLSLPLGAVRLTETFLRHDPVRSSEARALIDHIDETLEQVGWLRLGAREQLVLVGGTARALAKVDQEERAYPVDRLHGYRLTRRAAQKQMERLLDARLKERSRIDGLNSERADIIPAGAAVIARLARHSGASDMLISGQGLREGVFFEELLLHRARIKAAQLPAAPAALHRSRPNTPIARVADVRALGVVNAACRYRVDWTHAAQVLRLALSLFDALRRLHGFGAREREWLAAAALLHDIGVAVDYYRHHRHSAYLIENADLPGFEHAEIAVIALLARWHRQGNPKPEGYAGILGADGIDRVRKLSAILRLAEDLERSRAQVVAGVQCTAGAEQVRIVALTRGRGEAELWAANRNADSFRSIFKRDLRVSGTRTTRRPVAPPPDGTIFERARWWRQMQD